MINFKLKSINENVKADGVKYFLEFESVSFLTHSKITLDLSKKELHEHKFEVGEEYKLKLEKKENNNNTF